MGQWIRQRSLGILFVSLFLASWIVQLVATAYLVYAGSSESPDSEERIEAKLDALLAQSGVDPKDIEKTLAPKHQKRT